MKGVVFTEFLDMVEDKFGYDMVDTLLDSNELPSGGVYTAVGTYQHSEMVQLVTTLSQESKLDVPTLLKTYGKHLFTRFKAGYPAFINAADNAFDFLESIEHYIHVEVRKLYPDAELPSFETNRPQEGTLEMIYKSERKMADFAEGLIEGTLEHFQMQGSILREKIKPDGSEVRFTIKKEA